MAGTTRALPVPDPARPGPTRQAARVSRTREVAGNVAYDVTVGSVRAALTDRLDPTLSGRGRTAGGGAPAEGPAAVRVCRLTCLVDGLPALGRYGLCALRVPDGS